MELSQFPERYTERLLLRRPKESDRAMISYLRSDIEVNQFVKRPSAESKEKALEFISKTNTGIDNLNIYYWVITARENDQMIGSICLWNFSKDRKTAEVGYDLSPKFQMKGIMNEALVSVLEYGFEKLHLSLIEAYTHRKNESSKKLLERNRFIPNENRQDEDNHDNTIYELKRVLTDN